MFNTRTHRLYASLAEPSGIHAYPTPADLFLRTPPHFPYSLSEDPASKRFAIMSALSKHKRTRNGCLTCRARHVKCDEAKPICLRCRRSARTCSYPTVSTTNKNSSLSPSIEQNATLHHVEDIQSPRDWTAEPSFTETNPSGDGIFLAVRPTVDPQVFRLLKYYVEHIAPWLDLTDTENHFTRIVPQEMLRFPVLFHAVCAFSATQLSRYDHQYSKLAEMHHGKCVEEMIPVLQSEDFAADGRVLAATVILRMYEMLQCSPDQDSQRHLSGSWSLTQLPSQGQFDTLRIAAFWVFLRQDIQMAERHRRQTIIDLHKCQFLHSHSHDIHPADDDTVWANRMVWIYAQVVNHCFGPVDERTQDRWEFLNKQVDKWKEYLPESFVPLYRNSTSSELFPSEWFLCDWHVLGIQTYHMAKLLLGLYITKPIPDGVQGLREQRSRDETLKYHARAICGISITNSCQAARIHACEHLRICREVLVLPEDHERITKLLTQVQQDTGWPTFTSRGGSTMMEPSFDRCKDGEEIQ